MRTAVGPAGTSLLINNNNNNNNYNHFSLSYLHPQLTTGIPLLVGNGRKNRTSPAKTE